MPIYALTILIVLPIILFAIAPVIAEFNIPSFTAELVMAVTTLMCIRFLWQVEEKDKPNKILSIGFTFLFTALYTDSLDELFALPKYLTFILEDLFQLLGFLFVVVGVRMWLSLQHKQKKSLIKLATTDTLTGCFTRRYFTNQINHLLAEPNPRFCLLLFDIDHFKQINDVYGHNAGDHALIKFSKIIQTQVRDSDLFARWGGEEFIMMLPHISASTAKQKADEIRQQVSEMTIKYGNNQFSMTVSIGVAEYDQTLENFEKLVDIADQNLYLAKEQGRNRVIG